MTGAASNNSQEGLRPTVSIVIPTLNNSRLLVQCLLSLRQLDYPANLIEIVVADNGSTDGTGDMLSRRFPHVKHVNLGENTGFAAACDRGASEASGDYLAFLNNDAVPEPGWLAGLFDALDAGGEGAVCAGSHIRSRDGREIEFSGASANIFGVGRPRPVWGWPDSPHLPTEGSPILFASGGAMLIHRRTFLDAGGFDKDFFAYFEDVDLGWRLWLLGHKVVYAPRSVVRHTGGATGNRLGAHKRYTLWECNSLAVILKNYETARMERVLSAALLLLYKRALLSAGDSVNPQEYELTSKRDTNEANVERISKVSVAHLAAIDRFNRLLPRFMEQRRQIQARRVRPDSEILPLLGRAYEPQYAGPEYAEAVRRLANDLNLYGLTETGAPNRVLVVGLPGELDAAMQVARYVEHAAHVSVALVAEESTGKQPGDNALYAFHEDDPSFISLLEQADALLVLPGALDLRAVEAARKPIAVVGRVEGARPVPGGARLIASTEDPVLLDFCRRPGAPI